MKTRVTLFLKKIPSVPVEAESINPESVTAKGIREIEDLPLWVGNTKEKVGDYFRVEVAGVGEAGEVETGSGSEPDRDDQDRLATLVLRGDLSRFKRLG